MFRILFLSARSVFRQWSLTFSLGCRNRIRERLTPGRSCRQRSCQIQFHQLLQPVLASPQSVSFDTDRVHPAHPHVLWNPNDLWQISVDFAFLQFSKVNESVYARGFEYFHELCRHLKPHIHTVTTCDHSPWKLVRNKWNAPLNTYD